MSSSDTSRIRAQLSRLPGMAQRTATAVAPKLKDLHTASFDAQQDPYGNAWRGLKASTLKYRKGGPMLVESGKMRATGFQVEARGETIAMGPGAPSWTRYHISTGGRRTMPQPGRLPPAWRDAVQREIEAQVEAARRGA